METVGTDLGLKPADPIRVEILGAPADLAKLSPLTEAEIEKTGTIALSKYNKLMVVSPRATLFGYPWMDTLVHEYTHLIVSRIAFDAVPVWLQEGIARFEQTRWRRPPEVVLNATEQALLTSGLKKGRLISFDEMHPVDGEAAEPGRGRARVRGGVLARRLDARADRLQGLRDALAAEGRQERAPRGLGALDKTWGAVDKEWRAQDGGRREGACR